jgi:sugar/nucleoside kinase (ribokinase family)
VCAGGQAANVAAWAASLGAGARFVGKRGADDAAALATRELEARGVAVAGPAEGRTGVVVAVAVDGDRSLASDRGSAPGLRPDELEPAWFECDALHVSGYALHCEPLASAAVLAAELARAAGARVSVDLGAWPAIDDAFRARLRGLAPDLVFADEREAAAAGALDASWVVKRGADGIAVDGEAHPALPVEVVDATGAGDALAAGFLLGGPKLGLEAAARCCAKLGAMP